MNYGAENDLQLYSAKCYAKITLSGLPDFSIRFPRASGRSISRSRRLGTEAPGAKV